MLDKVQLQQKLNTILILLTITCFVLNPLYTAIIAAAYILFTRWLNEKYLVKYRMFLFAVTVVLLMIMFAKDNYSLFSATENLESYLLYFSPIKNAITCALALLLTYHPLVLGIDKFVIEDARKKQHKGLTEVEDLDFDDHGHTFVAGTTGSGKTVSLLKYAENSIKNGDPVYILSGKASGSDPYSFLAQIRKLCEKYNRKLYVVSADPNIKERVQYNPFDGMTVTEFADAIAQASEFSEPHYKYATIVTIKVIAEVLRKAKLTYSLQRLLHIWDFEKFMSIVHDLADKEILSREEIAQYGKMEDLFKEASLSRSRFLNLTLGEGSEVLGSGNGCINASKVREENAILFVDLDAFRYVEFTQILGKLFFVDMKHLVSTERCVERKKRIIMDEVGAYIGEATGILPLFSQSRSYGYQIIAATQSLADLDAVDETLTERLLENCNQYVILQMNSAKDAERIAELIGTRLAVETTRKSDGSLLSGGFEGTKKAIEEFIVHPNRIKRLQKLQVILYQKNRPEQVSFIAKLSYINLGK